ncbi:MAG: hypothetical protein O7H40_11160 [Gammaproteobacteria bacterium]|nr:hypothetical protein [Gammaproteobacteria bacterium]
MSFKEWSAGLKLPTKNSTADKSQVLPAANQPATQPDKSRAEVTPVPNQAEIDAPDEGGES